MELLCDVTKYSPSCLLWWGFNFQTLFTGLVAIVIAGLQVRLSFSQHRWNMEQNETQQALAKVEVLRVLRAAYDQWDKIVISGIVGHTADGEAYYSPEIMAIGPASEVMDAGSFSQIVAKAYPEKAVELAELQQASAQLSRLAEEYKQQPWIDVNDLSQADVRTDRDIEKCRLTKQATEVANKRITVAMKIMIDEGVL